MIISTAEKQAAWDAAVAHIKAQLAAMKPRIYSHHSLVLSDNTNGRLGESFTNQKRVFQTSLNPPLPLWITSKRAAIRAIKTDRQWGGMLLPSCVRWAMLRDALQRSPSNKLAS